jgi:hypothetical protein
VNDAAALRAVKLLHTVVWAVLAACVVAIIPVALLGDRRLAAALCAVVTVEVLVLAFNRFHCPLTAVAARYTTERQDNFDIYLPLWLAKHNQHVFGALFVVGLVLTVLRWV